MGAEIFLYGGQSGGQCVLKYLQSTDCTQYPVPNLINLKEVSYEDRLGLLTKSILDGYSGSDLSGLNFGDNECWGQSVLTGKVRGHRC